MPPDLARLSVDAARGARGISGPQLSSRLVGRDLSILWLGRLEGFGLGLVTSRIVSISTLNEKEHCVMPKFLIQLSYTPEGAKGVLKAGGSARRKAAADVLAQFNGKIEAFYFAFGADDAVLIVEVPDQETMAAISLTVSASGMIRTRATALLTPEQIDEAAKKHVDFRRPGA